MKAFLAPLGVFVVGNLIILFVVLFFPAINTSATQLEADTAGFAANFWGWSWVVSSTRFLVFIILELLVLYGTAKAFLANH